MLYLKKNNWSTISLCFLSSRRSEEPANFLAAPDFFFQAAPAPGFFSSGSDSCSKEPIHPAPTGSGSPALQGNSRKVFGWCRLSCLLHYIKYLSLCTQTAETTSSQPLFVNSPIYLYSYVNTVNPSSVFFPHK